MKRVFYAVAVVLFCGTGVLKAAEPDEVAARKSFEEMVQAVRDVDIAAFYKKLPVSTQNQIRQVMKAGAEKIGKELWGPARTLVEKTGTLFVNKTDLLSETFGFTEGKGGKALPPAEKKKTLEMIKNAGASVANYSKYLTYENVSKGNIEAILMAPGFKKSCRLFLEMGDLDEIMPPMKFASSKKQGEYVELTYHTKDGKPDTNLMMKVDGTWAPKEIVDGVRDGCAEALAGIKGFEFPPEKKSSYLKMIKQFSVLVDDVATVTDKDIMQLKLTTAMMQVMMMVAQEQKAAEGKKKAKPAAK